jgi:hypothetical protein
MLVIALVCALQDRAPTPYEVIPRYEKVIRSVNGVLEIAVGAGPSIIVRVKDRTAKEGVALICGAALEGIPLHVLLSTEALPTSSACAHCPEHCGPGKTVVGPAPTPPPTPTKVDTKRLDDPQYQQDTCDVIRKWLGKPKLTHGDPPCQEMVSVTNDVSKVLWVIKENIPHWRSQEMKGLAGSDLKGVVCPDHGTHAGGETLCYTWVKHRQFCPLGTRQILKEIQDMSPSQGPRK